MYIFAYGMLILALLASLGGAGLAVMQLFQGRASALWFIEKAQALMTMALVLASAILLHALYWNDFSLVYVASYTDKLLPIFYRLTAFWAGQPGSLLFWALSVAVAGTAFSFTPSYKNLTEETRLWFWIFFLGIMAFFALLLTGWSNPFTIQDPAPADGRGLNPLLQNPGMIFHPPLLFWGYGGFVIPGCLALAQCLSDNEEIEGSWVMVARPFTLWAWLFLTAGIILGAWWAYMELGWGGYWAWDPVENASIIPWLLGTAALHTTIIQVRRGKLGRVNVFLMALTTVSAFFATYLVRSGVVQSVHAFGDGGVGTPLLIFIIASTLLCLLVACVGYNSRKSLVGIDSREGMLVVTAWILIMLSIIICLGTLWPIISKLWSAQSQGLDATFYNKVCLPLFALMAVIFSFCPWLGWNGGIRNMKKLMLVLASFVVTAVVLWVTEYRQATSFMAISASVAALVSLGMLVMEKSVRSQINTLAAHGVHLGLIMIVMGVAFSGPYKIEKDILLSKGESAQVGNYTVGLVDVAEGRTKTYDYLEARLQVTDKDSVLQGVLAPQMRIYNNFSGMKFSEVGTIFSLGNEFYASLLGIDHNNKATLRVSINPLVNWLWIGGTLMCLFPILGLRRKIRSQVPDEDEEEASTEVAEQNNTHSHNKG